MRIVYALLLLCPPMTALAQTDGESDCAEWEDVEDCTSACEDSICLDGGCEEVDPDGSQVGACAAECEACQAEDGTDGTGTGTDPAGTAGTGGRESCDEWSELSDADECPSACEGMICLDGGCEEVDPDGTQVAECVAECTGCLESDGTSGTDGTDSTDSTSGTDGTDSTDSTAPDPDTGQTDAVDGDGTESTPANDATGSATGSDESTGAGSGGGCQSGGGAHPAALLVLLLLLGFMTAARRAPEGD